MKSSRSYRIARLAVIVALLLMVPLVAMQFSDEVVWTLSDFVVAGILLFGAGLTYELVASRGPNTAYRAAVGLAVGSGLFLIWSNLAVGLIGDEGNRANLMYLGVLAVGFVGALVARFQARGMARALFAMAAAHTIVGGIALALGLGGPVTPPVEIIGVTGFFVALFVGAGLLFLVAARGEQPVAGAGS